MPHTSSISRTEQCRLDPRPQGRRHRPGADASRTTGSLAAYDRRTELPRILPLWPDELADDSPRGRRLILARLHRALRAERRRGIAGHWTYDLAATPSCCASTGSSWQGRCQTLRV